MARTTKAVKTVAATTRVLDEFASRIVFVSSEIDAEFFTAEDTLVAEEVAIKRDTIDQDFLRDMTHKYSTFILLNIHYGRVVEIRLQRYIRVPV